MTSTSATFEFTSTESGSTFACSLDSAAYQSCTSPQSYSGLSAATHPFSVRATDRRATPIHASDAELDSLPTCRYRGDVPAGGRCARVGVESHQKLGLSTTLRADGGADPDVGELPAVHRDRRVGSGDQREAAAAHHQQPRQGKRQRPSGVPRGTGWSETGITWRNRPTAQPRRLRTRAAHRGEHVAGVQRHRRGHHRQRHLCLRGRLHLRRRNRHLLARSSPLPTRADRHQRIAARRRPETTTPADGQRPMGGHWHRGPRPAALAADPFSPNVAPRVDQEVAPTLGRRTELGGRDVKRAANAARGRKRLRLSPAAGDDTADGGNGQPSVPGSVARRTPASPAPPPAERSSPAGRIPRPAETNFGSKP